MAQAKKRWWDRDDPYQNTFWTEKKFYENFAVTVGHPHPHFMGSLFWLPKTKDVPRWAKWTVWWFVLAGHYSFRCSSV
ncbi:hypothetical protein CTI12_AA204350 [Artemisia annua]|uniref:Uncharacterized protein n=1 Tax=Artemisia annua TaxID=35608 RepID=A0A2U1P2F1_ARTAN|nr:hypothetical protein CTI12_AA204350 [Artemisia annua]